MRTWARREYDEHHCGGPLRRLSLDHIRITPRGIGVVRRHISRFGPDPPRETAMIERLDLIVAGRTSATRWDLAFYAHELREFVRFRRLQVSSGEDYEVWNNAHTACLEEYGEDGSMLYHPDVPAP